MPDTSGYYKLDGANLLHAPNAVHMPKGVTLTRDKPPSKPVDGWRWFADRAAACAALGYEDNEVVESDVPEVQVTKLRAQLATKDAQIAALKASAVTPVKVIA